ncbi:NAD(P)H-dependent oxidoreductase [Candidatus Wolfebacteria bacterium]|nr:NAD(P)H-dependent oxidoreductase [Candidatus Wolfebacteria bacterium]
MENLKVLGISGSLRRDSYNRKALQVAKKIATDLGAEVSEIDLKELNLPIYDGDIEALGLPENVRQFKSAVEASDVILIASPEYNYSISGALKTALEWGSRGGGNSFDGKWAIIFGASPGLVGTLRGQFQLRQIFYDLNVLALPQPQVFIRNAREAFDTDGTFKDLKTYEQLKKLIQKTFEVVEKLKN